MAEEMEGSVTRWLGDLKTGDGDAAQKLWGRYFESLVRLAQTRLRTSNRAAEDEEDAALSAFDSFFAAASRGRFPQLNDRDDLWRVLVTITSRKALNQARKQRRQRRGGGRVVAESTLAETAGDRGVLDRFAAPEPAPEFAAMFAEECSRRLDDLGDDSLRRVALLRMEGYTNEEIAGRLGLRLRSLSRKIELIRRTWLGEDEA
jgi:DNA-directed RNA polymerase specialized sigma24 family protein